MYGLAVVALALAPLTSPVAGTAGQPLQSSAWEPWYGCWRAEGAPAGEAVCIAPDGGGIRLVTLDQGVVRGDSRVYPDGEARERQQDGCTMVEWSRWSADRERVFLTSELTCDGQATRRSQGLMAFTSSGEWLSVQTINGEEGSALRTVRFTPAGDVRVPADLAGLMPRRVLSRSGIAAIDESDVVEATDVLDPETVGEWLRVAGAPYQLSDAYAGSVTSALDDFDRLSQPVEYRTVNVVHILEPSWCIFGSCSWLRSRWCWEPWGYDRFAWRAYRPVYYLRPPLLVRIGIDIGLGRGIRIARYDGWGRDRDRWRYDTPWRDYRPGRGIAVARSGGSVGRDGYTPPSRPGTGRGSVRDEGRSGGDRGSVRDETRTGADRGTAVRRDETGSGGERGSIVRRDDQPGSADGRGSSVRGSDSPGASRGTAIRRTDVSRSSGSSGSTTVRPGLPRSSGSSGTVTVRPSDSRGSGSGGSITVRPSEPRSNSGSITVRPSEPRASSERGTVSGRGYSVPSAPSRGSAVQRERSSSGSAPRVSAPSRSSEGSSRPARASAPSRSSEGSSRPARASAPSRSSEGSSRPARASAPSRSEGGASSSRGTAKPRN